MATPLAIRVVESQFLTYRRVWKGSVFSSFLSPLLFLLAMGLGLGSLVDGGDRTEIIEGVSYLVFLAPGLLVANAMQTGVMEGSFPVMAGMKWIKTYHAMLASPIGAPGLISGHYIWVAVRLALVSSVFGVIAAMLGAMGWLDVVFVIPIGILVGLSVAAPMTAFTATLDTAMGLTNVFRFGVMPMFLFSGTFFPIDLLPGWLQPVAVATPLWHAVELARRVALDVPSTLPLWQHAGYLVSLFIVGAWLSLRWFSQKMLP